MQKPLTEIETALGPQPVEKVMVTRLFFMDISDLASNQSELERSLPTESEQCRQSMQAGIDAIVLARDSIKETFDRRLAEGEKI